jgi:serine/threonine protein kinase
MAGTTQSGGSVYTGVHLTLGQKVAIKVMRPQAAMDEWWRGRCITESRIYARINSSYVVKVHDFGEETDGSMYLVMEYLPGVDLYKMLEKTPVLQTSTLCRLAVHMLQGLVAAHDHGIVHRDLKPANVMILDPDSDKPFATLLDFGIGKVDGEAAAPSLQVDADIYSLGVMLYPWTP